MGLSVVLAVSLVATGCTSSDEPDDEPTASGSPTVATLVRDPCDVGSTAATTVFDEDGEPVAGEDVWSCAVQLDPAHYFLVQETMTPLDLDTIERTYQERIDEGDDFVAVQRLDVPRTEGAVVHVEMVGEAYVPVSWIDLGENGVSIAYYTAETVEDALAVAAGLTTAVATAL